MKDLRSRWLWMGLCFVISIFFLTGSSALSAERPPIKVGTLLGYTGTMPLQAKYNSDAAELGFHEVGNKAGGRAIQFIKEDDELSPTVGLTKLRRLVEEHKVNFVIGPISSAVGLAIHDYIRDHKVIQFNPGAATKDLTAPPKAADNIFRTCDTTDQTCYPMGKWMFNKTPYRNLVLVGSDFAAGHDYLDAFKAGFVESGGKILKEVYPKLGTMDFAPFLAAIDVKGADAVFAWFAGTDAVRFTQQYAEFGLKKRLPLYSHSALVDDPYLPSIGDAALGIITVTNWALTIDTPRNNAWIKSYMAKWGEVPGRWGEFGYTASQCIREVAEALNGDIEDIPRTAREIRRVAAKIETPSGPLAFDQYNQRDISVYVQKVEKRDGKLANVIFESLGKFGQQEVWKWWYKK